MACEKIAKAYRFRDTPTSIEELMTQHVAFSKFIENLMKSSDIQARYRGRDNMLRNVARSARQLAREIEKLAPAVDRERFPENTEYPWTDGRRIVVPCEYRYPIMHALSAPDGLYFLKLIKMAIEDFERIRIS